MGSGGRDFRCGDCWLSWLSKIAAGGRTGHGERVAAAAAAWGVVVVECVDQSDGSESVCDWEPEAVERWRGGGGWPR